MTNKKGTKRALLASLVSLLLCFSMLIGTTYAWFTDSVKSTNNIITAGNLDVELEFAKVVDGKMTDWAPLKEDSNVFSATYWEPGHAEVVYLRVSNRGTLSLKYQLGINIAEETGGINVYGDTFKLSDYIMVGVDEKFDGNNYADRATAISKVTTGFSAISKGYAKSGELAPKEASATDYPADCVALVVYMPETVENDANYKTGTTAPFIKLGISVFATQLAAEMDSFGPDYDKDAAWTGGTNKDWYTKNPDAATFTLLTAEDLAGLAEIVNAGTDTFKGKAIYLAADVDLNNINWTPIGTKTNKFSGSFYGYEKDDAGNVTKQYTISNLRVVGEKGVGLFGYTASGTHIEGVSIENAYVSGNDYVGTILGNGYISTNCIKYCTVKNATVVATPYLTDAGIYDGGAKAGVIAGFAVNGHIIGNTVIDSSVTAYRDLGGIVGWLNGENHPVEATGNTVSGVTLNFVGVAGPYDKGTGNENMNSIVGRKGNNVTIADNMGEDEVIKNEANKNATMIFTLAELIDFANKVNGGDTYKGKTVMLGADIDLLNMEWTPIGNSTTNFQGTFDGQGHTIKNLNVNMPGKSNAGFFGMTTDGEVKNLIVENATVTGRLNVGVVAGTPYTTKYSNITVKGHVEVTGMSYVGAAGGKNAYANWTDVTVNVDDTSFVIANSVENGKAYRTYVGGVVGFMGEGTHSFTNVTSNIDVIGTTCDVGGIVGIAHEGNSFTNCSSSGNVTITGAIDAGDAEEIGGIAGVWMNSGRNVTFTDCVFTGTLTTNITDGVDLSDNTITGKGYNATTSNELIILNYVKEDGIEYVLNGVSGDKVLYLIPSDYAEATVNVPEGVTAIGNYAFAYNSNVKEVVLSSTIRDLGRGFDSSTVEKVVLNEGLTTISSRAFRSTTALKEVVFSSTVTEIADNAFQKSGIKEIVIPANVETIGETAFGASLIEKVTFEGDIAIQGFAFRGCTKLRTVYMNGYDVTFVKSTLNGRNSTWFCNNESNNPNTSDIDFYVKNEVIKERVLTAMGAERNNTDVYCEITNVEEGGYFLDENGDALAYDAEALVAALEAGKNVTLFDDSKIEPAGMSNAYGTTGINVKNGQTIDGQGNVLDIKGAGGTWDSGISTTGGTIKNITVTGSFRGIFVNHNSDHCEKVVLEKVIIDGTVYTISCDQGKYQNLEATNCTFNGWTSYAATIGNVKFTDCSFGEGSGYAFCRPYAPTEFVGCDFEEGFRVDPRAAITFENCTVGGVALTAENLSTLVTNINNASVK